MWDSSIEWHYFDKDKYESVWFPLVLYENSFFVAYLLYTLKEELHFTKTI